MKGYAGLLKNTVGLIIMAIHFVPFYILITMAFKKTNDYTSRWTLPDYFFLDNFRLALGGGKLLQAMMNSMVVTTCSVLLIALLGAMAAYPLARVKNRFNLTMISFILAVMMVPKLTILVPLYSLVAGLGGVSTFWGIILLITTYKLPACIFLYSNFIATIPKALDEAATIDGCSKFSVFYRILLPSMMPVTATVIIMNSVSIWNDYSFSLYFMQSPLKRTVTLAISSFFSQNNTNLNAAAAAALLAIIPATVLYLSLQKHFVKGMVDGSVK
ncbi:carbohydrate ABC transporter permease [Paenibacillus radicis (ex Xue et al. 2023)]|uniref:Carbohydrate ABC transporter permease n=1 Tax=Paenibacillus radicis (ex Xue et al. 2023) TaxID=2972489 RepID=A0ABT1YB63_9BACL|nr:carbohydrate ABC transporter permease [Paenibacillus radicis (ex Xue et al. 2023)]MCR8630439.1 carbohydrate ABC transporter permease [Paenibacillus radicis (ex Xue et al. 2023)]